ncbi:uncharacterized protein [Amphiura filiformis]|uniref:uncharacterized protein n=1 Tax=Amphiura filiformis TaxID=82378 RepID=UPI003B20B806
MAKKSTYDLLPIPANLSVWYEDKTDCCNACGKKGTLQHILSACTPALASGMYTWRHNNILRVILEAVKLQVDRNNVSQAPTNTKRYISFVKEGSQCRSYERSSILSSANDWRIRADQDGKGGFPREIVITTLRPDIVIWSEPEKEGIIGELTVPWEDNIDEAHERKLTKYSELRAECKDRGWKASCYPFEVGCRGFVVHSLQKWLRDLGANRRELKSVSRAASEAAESGSSWVWSKYIKRSR